MEISVLIEPSCSKGFRATAPSHPEITVEAATEAAAIEQLRDQLCERLKQAKMVTVDVPLISDKPWMAAAGCLADQPNLAAYQEAIAEYRRQANLPDETVPHPWEIAFGAFRDHPDLPDVMENMRIYREQRDQEAELP